jgi:hypothetical protein
VPPGIGALCHLEGLQLEGCPLAPPLDALARKDPLLIVALHNARTTALDLSEASGCWAARVPAGMDPLCDEAVGAALYPCLRPGVHPMLVTPRLAWRLCQPSCCR